MKKLLWNTLTASVDRPLALWGGIECTVNRVGNVYHDQLIRSGHQERIEDLDLLAGLGLDTIRYPVVWERVAPVSLEACDWRWTDERLARLKTLGVRPIAGLVHHGSGPTYASFDGPDFEHQLARFARMVAERYPWIEAYTPINEPLTTARFAGLYGHWYPHEHTPKAFAEILLRECLATVRAMQAIRTVRPDAQLVQTDDLGQTFSSPRLQYQADFENERRWLSWDLLCGRVVPGHSMWKYLRYLGIPEQDILFFAENPCPPSIIGINHYLTSERYLDEDLAAYPAHLHGSNGRDHYVDTEVVRAAPDQRVGPGGLVKQAWERYGLPIAITEAHLGCTVDEQMRWLADVWQQAEAARKDGVDIRAVTVWAMLGSFDWHCLVTRCEGYYEPGVFDVSSGAPCPTELAPLVAALARQQPITTLVPPGPGWWQIEQPVLLN